jgi:hypothetical protein
VRRCVAAAAVLVALATTASAAGTPRAVLPRSANVLGPAVGVAASGEATAVWTRGHERIGFGTAARAMRIEAAVGTATGGLGKPRVLARDAGFPHLAVNGRGEAVAFWTDDRGRIRWATHSSGEPFGAARPFGHRGHVAAVLAGPRGRFYVAWLTRDKLRVADGTLSGSFGTPAEIRLRDAAGFDFEVNRHGTMMVLAEETFRVPVWLRSPGLRLRRVGKISGGSGGEDAVLRPDGSILALSSGCGPRGATGICEQVRPRGGRFSRPRPIACDGQFAQLGVDRRGRVTAAWHVDDGSDGPGGVALATARPGRGLGPGWRVAGHGASPGLLAVGPGGRRLLTWEQNTKGGRAARLHAASWSAQPTRGHGRTLDRHPVDEHAIAVAGGDAIVVWSRMKRGLAGGGLFYSFVTSGD